MRGFLAGLLAALGLLVVPLADVGVWTERELLPTPAFTDLAVDVFHEDEVQLALAQRLTDEIVNRVPALGLSSPILRGAVLQGIGTSQFELLLRASLSDMHGQLTNGDDPLALNLDAALPLVREQVARIDAGVAAQIPTGSVLPSITVLTRDEVPPLWDSVQIARRVWWLFLALALLLLAGAVLLADDRARMLIVVGVGVAVIAIVLAALVRFGRAPLSDVVGSDVSVDAFDAGYDVVTDTFVVQTVVLGALGIIATVAGVVGVAVRHGSSRPRGWA